MSKSIAIATWKFGLPAVVKAGEILAAGGSAMDAVEQGINVAELAEDVLSVGFGGLPNAKGVVEMDAAIIDGSTHAVGSVAALQNCKTPISVARAVLEKCRHSMLVGEGARAFADEHGFAPENTLSDKASEKYQNWKKDKTNRPEFMHDTIGLLAFDQGGALVAGCSTSGMAYKLPGRVGDSPLIGGGLYADIKSGAASATGNGDEILKFCMSFLAVEYMRQGAAPKLACENVLARYMEAHPEKSKDDISLIAISKSCEYGAATLRDNFPFGVWENNNARREVVTRFDANLCD